MSMLDISGVGFSACSSWLNCEKDPEEEAAPAGMGGSPFTVETTISEKQLCEDGVVGLQY